MGLVSVSIIIMEHLSTMTLEEIVDTYVQKARAKTRLTEYEREERGGYTLHRVTENDQFRILDHRIAVQDHNVAWIWRKQDFWPTDELTDVTLADRDLYNFGVIHGGNRVAGVKFTFGPRWGAGSDPDNCLPFVNDYLHLEAHYRVDRGTMKLNRARIGVDFLSKDGRTLLARSVYADTAHYQSHGYRYRSSLGARLLLEVTGHETAHIDLPVRLSDSEVEHIYDTVKMYGSNATSTSFEDIFVVKRDY